MAYYIVYCIVQYSTPWLWLIPAIWSLSQQNHENVKIPREKETNDELRKYKPVDVGWENREKTEQNDYSEGREDDSFTTELVGHVADKRGPDCPADKQTGRR